jgi:hypothetical protein
MPRGHQEAEERGAEYHEHPPEVPAEEQQVALLPQGVSSQSATTYSVIRKVRYTVPRFWACRLVMIASTRSRLTRQRKTLGRMFSRRFTITASSSASGRAPCVMALPTIDGIGMSRDCPLHVLG